MADLWLEWKGDAPDAGDLSLDASGDLLLADGDDMVQQRIIRRLLTAVRGYVWHQDYGAGLPQRIGKVARARSIQALVNSQIALETTVARLPIPVVTVAENETAFGLFNIAITYFDAASGAAVKLDFEVPTTSS